MVRGIGKLLKVNPPDVWEEAPGVVAAVNANGSYDVTSKGATIGPVWSVNQARLEVGASVTVLFRGGVPQGIVP